MILPHIITDLKFGKRTIRFTIITNLNNGLPTYSYNEIYKEWWHTAQRKVKQMFAGLVK